MKRKDRLVLYLSQLQQSVLLDAFGLYLTSCKVSLDMTDDPIKKGLIRNDMDFILRIVKKINEL